MGIKGSKTDKEKSPQKPALAALVFRALSKPLLVADVQRVGSHMVNTCERTSPRSNDVVCCQLLVVRRKFVVRGLSLPELRMLSLDVNTFSPSEDLLVLASKKGDVLYRKAPNTTTIPIKVTANCMAEAEESA